MLAQSALKYDLKVQKNGHVEISVPFPPGERVTVFVIRATETFDDLINAAGSSLDFWDNRLDDEDWNNA